MDHARGFNYNSFDNKNASDIDLNDVVVFDRKFPKEESTSDEEDEDVFDDDDDLGDETHQVIVNGFMQTLAAASNNPMDDDNDDVLRSTDSNSNSISRYIAGTADEHELNVSGAELAMQQQELIQELMEKVERSEDLREELEKQVVLTNAGKREIAMLMRRCDDLENEIVKINLDHNRKLEVMKRKCDQTADVQRKADAEVAEKVQNRLRNELEQQKMVSASLQRDLTEAKDQLELELIKYEELKRHCEELSKADSAQMALNFDRRLENMKIEASMREQQLLDQIGDMQTQCNEMKREMELHTKAATVARHAESQTMAVEERSSVPSSPAANSRMLTMLKEELNALREQNHVLMVAQENACRERDRSIEAAEAKAQLQLTRAKTELLAQHNAMREELIRDHREKMEEALKQRDAEWERKREGFSTPGRMNTSVAAAASPSASSLSPSSSSSSSSLLLMMTRARQEANRAAEMLEKLRPGLLLLKHSLETSAADRSIRSTSSTDDLEENDQDSIQKYQLVERLGRLQTIKQEIKKEVEEAMTKEKEQLRIQAMAELQNVRKKAEQERMVQLEQERERLKASLGEELRLLREGATTVRMAAIETLSQENDIMHQNTRKTRDLEFETEREKTNKIIKELREEARVHRETLIEETSSKERQITTEAIQRVVDDEKRNRQMKIEKAQMHERDLTNDAVEEVVQSRKLRIDQVMAHERQETAKAVRQVEEEEREKRKQQMERVRAQEQEKTERAMMEIVHEEERNRTARLNQVKEEEKHKTMKAVRVLEDGEIKLMEKVLLESDNERKMRIEEKRAAEQQKTATALKAVEAEEEESRKIQVQQATSRLKLVTIEALKAAEKEEDTVREHQLQKILESSKASIRDAIKRLEDQQQKARQLALDEAVEREKMMTMQALEQVQMEQKELRIKEIEEAVEREQILTKEIVASATEEAQRARKTAVQEHEEVLSRSLRVLCQELEIEREAALHEMVEKMASELSNDSMGLEQLIRLSNGEEIARRLEAAFNRRWADLAAEASSRIARAAPIELSPRKHAEIEEKLKGEIMKIVEEGERDRQLAIMRVTEEEDHRTKMHRSKMEEMEKQERTKVEAMLREKAQLTLQAAKRDVAEETERALNEIRNASERRRKATEAAGRKSMENMTERLKEEAQRELEREIAKLKQEAEIERRRLIEQKVALNDDEEQDVVKSQRVALSEMAAKMREEFKLQSEQEIKRVKIEMEKETATALASARIHAEQEKQRQLELIGVQYQKKMESARAVAREAAEEEAAKMIEAAKREMEADAAKQLEKVKIELKKDLEKAKEAELQKREEECSRAVWALKNQCRQDAQQVIAVLKSQHEDSLASAIGKEHQQAQDRRESMIKTLKEGSSRAKELAMQQAEDECKDDLAKQLKDNREATTSPLVAKLSPSKPTTVQERLKQISHNFDRLEQMRVSISTSGSKTSTPAPSPAKTSNPPMSAPEARQQTTISRRLGYAAMNNTNSPSVHSSFPPPRHPPQPSPSRIIADALHSDALDCGAGKKAAGTPCAVLAEKGMRCDACARRISQLFASSSSSSTALVTPSALIPPRTSRTFEQQYSLRTATAEQQQKPTARRSLFGNN